MTPDSSTSRCVGERTLWLWQGQAACLGTSFQLDTHSTPVQCFVLGVDAMVTVRTPDGGRWQRRSALIPARTTHRLESSGRVLFYYLDPRAAAAARSRAAMREPPAPVATGHRDEAALTTYLNQSGPPDPRELRRIIAAADAGFASASHFSDTFRMLFGLTATEALAHGMNIVVVPDTEQPPRPESSNRPDRTRSGTDSRRVETDASAPRRRSE